AQARSRFAKNVGRWAYLLRHATQTLTPPFEQCDLHWRAALSTAAVVNVKKTGGRGCSDLREIRNHFRQHSARFFEQVNLLAPRIIVTCGVGLFEILRPALPNVQAVGRGRHWEGGRLWIDFAHPSRRGSSDASLLRDLATLYDRAVRPPAPAR
ncbi:MAG: hypothetical protein M3478_12245, partial [Planctomycetota bacterium]|nr:hypothetical protein [Planctomycetota bacterium]